MKDDVHPAAIIADLLASTLMPREGWGTARAPYCWERDGLDYLHRLKAEGSRPPINAWTAMLVDQGYPAAKSGPLQGKFWKPPQ
jgi:hypothetical protein